MSEHLAVIRWRMSGEDFKHGRYTLGPYVHLERTPGPMSQTSPTQLPLPFEGCRGYEWAYAEGFALECRAIRRVREDMGLTNLVVMLPFVRRLAEADAVVAANDMPMVGVVTTPVGGSPDPSPPLHPVTSAAAATTMYRRN